MSTAPSTAPVLSTPDDHILSESTGLEPLKHLERLSDIEILSRYEVQRTAAELVQGRWTTIALQFPDELLKDAPRVVELLNLELLKTPVTSRTVSQNEDSELETSMNEVSVTSKAAKTADLRRLYILGDTSYGACCVDEIAAEHISAQVVVHYGRACLSPTARLPVIYVFTKQPLDHDTLVQAFKDTYADRESKIILLADVIFSSHIDVLHSRLKNQEGYKNIYAPEIVHDPSSPIPNRSLTSDLKNDPEELKNYAVFHISTPPTALLLTLSSRVADMTIYPTDTNSLSSGLTVRSSTAALLRRRYGLLTSLSAVPIFGILINTLSVASYQSAAANIASQLKAAGKKSYTFVVGKINAAKVANFAEVGGWIVVGCWESSLVEGDGFWKPVITPFELELVLKGDKGRVWTGEWNGGFSGWLTERKYDVITADNDVEEEEEEDGDPNNVDSEDESAPPEFDLRTGRYVSNSTPLRTGTSKISKTPNSSALVKRSKGDIAVIGSEVSPGAEFLRTQRTWRGLGSDIQIEYDEEGQESGTLVKEGRSGVARGYANEHEDKL